jgi:hypothetical protein
MAAKEGLAVAPAAEVAGVSAVAMGVVCMLSVASAVGRGVETGTVSVGADVASDNGSGSKGG